MSTIADFAIDADKFVLGWTLCEVPGVHIQVERVVVSSTAQVTPYFWATGDDLEAFEDALADDPTTRDAERLEDDGRTRLYRAEWTRNVQPLVYVLDDAKGAILQATGSEGRWELRLLFPDHETLSAFHEYSATYDLAFDLRRVYDSNGRRSTIPWELSEAQTEALRLAYERGYFEVPRETSMADLAAELGISSQALSKRLRRAHRGLVGVTVAHDPDATT